MTCFALYPCPRSLHLPTTAYFDRLPWTFVRLHTPTRLPTVTEKLLARDPLTDLRRAFALFDDDHTGRISMKNLKRVARELGENLGEEELYAVYEIEQQVSLIAYSLSRPLFRLTPSISPGRSPHTIFAYLSAPCDSVNLQTSDDRRVRPRSGRGDQRGRVPGDHDGRGMMGRRLGSQGTRRKRCGESGGIFGWTLDREHFGRRRSICIYNLSPSDSVVLER